MNERGIPCNLLTGQERKVTPEARITSSTVEMINLKKPIDVAVIDEIQMIGDEERGWAWTQALLGVPAKTIYLCGEASAVPLVKRICETTGDKLEVVHHQRLKPLEISNYSLNGQLSNIKKGDCIIAFSRQDVFNLKRLIEENTKLTCAVVYGALPPETRVEQSRLFNDSNSGYDVIVATDAVGMGLNL
jgi:ATP-dependent RNA helicase SUPV3L1/SUV3